jgi:hypothetical protein
VDEDFQAANAVTKFESVGSIVIKTWTEAFSSM